MANRNTLRARKNGLTNMAETTNGTGTSRQIVARNAEPIFKGKACDTSWDNPNSNRRSRTVYGRKNSGGE